MSFLKKLNVDSIKESLVDGVKAAQEGISNIDVDELVKNASDAATSGAKAIQDAVSSIDVEEAVKGAKEYVGSGKLKSDAARTVDNVKSVFTGEDVVARRKAEEKGRPEGEIVDVESVSEVPEEDEDNKD